jgi:hypothetical protein
VRSDAATALRNLPLTFERNDGQFAPHVRFAGVQSNGSIAIHDDGFSIADARQGMAPVAFTFVNASRGGAAGFDPQRTRSHYFSGSDPGNWHSNIPTFGRVRRDALYPNIDVVYYGRERQLEYDVVVRPGGDLQQVALRVDGGHARVDAATGDLLIEQRGRKLRQRRPIAYQEIGGTRREVAADYVIAADDQVSFAVGAYDRAADLVIDPVVTYSTYISADAMFVDSAGRMYIATWTGLASYGGPPRTDLAPAEFRYGLPGNTGIYLARLAPSGRELEFSTFIRTSYLAVPLVAVDPAGTIYLTGHAAEGDGTPITFGGAPPSGSSAFLAGFFGDGQLLWSRYVGNATRIAHMRPRPSGGVVVAGVFVESFSGQSSFAFPPTIGSPISGSSWVLKVTRNGGGDRPAYIGEAIRTWTQALAVGPDDSVYVAGETESPNLPVTAAALQSSVGTGATGFVTRLNSTQDAYVYSTYLGGTGRTRATSLAVDDAGSVYVAGYSTSTDFAPAPTQTTGTCAASTGPCANVFLTKILASGAVPYTNLLSIVLAPSFPNSNDPVLLSPPVLLTLNPAREPSLAFSTRSQTLPAVASVQPRPGEGPFMESVDGLRTFINRAHGPLCESPHQILIAPSDPRVIYVLNRDGDESALCRSDDGGRSWRRWMVDAAAISSDPGETPRLTVSPGDAHTLLFASVSGLKRSVDGGATWMASGTGLSHITTKVAYDPRDASVAYTSASVDPVVFRMFKSIDGGVTWAELPSAAFISLTAVLGTTPTTILGNAGQRSTDGGATWQQSSSATSVLPLASAPGNPSVVYGVQTNEPFHAVCRSDDAATTWSVCSVPPLDGTDGGTRVLSVSVDADDPRRVFGIFKAGVAYSFDGAASWIVLHRRRDGGVLAAHPTESNHLFVSWLSPGSDVAVVRFASDARRLLFSSYFGGTADDTPLDLQVDGADNLYLLGSTRSRDFPLNAPRRGWVGDASKRPIDLFLTRIQMRGTAPADFDADGRTDVSTFRSSTGEWFVKNSRTDTTDTIALGRTGDVPAAADFDGDGQADLAVFRPSNGDWLIRNSSTLAQRTVRWGGSAADIPAPADYDGDGKADIAFFRPSNGYWYILQSSTNSPRYVRWGGTTGDIPAPGDYDGDGRADIAFFRPSNGYWYLLRSTAGIQYVQWGGTTADVPTPGDYDGDGRTDAAFWRPSDNYWYVRSSRTGAARYVRWGGFSTDIPVPGDYDQDAVTDHAFFRPSDGYWYILQSRTRTARYVNLGTLGDIPIPSRR